MMLQTEKKNLKALWLAQTISQSGDAIYQLALLWLILDITESTTITGIIAMSAYLPALIFGLYAGVFSDRINRLKLMLFSNAAQALTVLMIPIVVFFHPNNVWLICGLAFLRSSFNTLFQPALQSLVPTLFEPKDIIKINSVLVTSGHIAWMAGPFFAGALLSLFSLVNLFFIDAFSFIVAMLFLLFIEQKTVVSKTSPVGHWFELKEGLTYLFNYQPLFYMMVMTFINNVFIMGPAIVGLPILVRTELNGTASDFAFIEGCMALGALCGSLIASKLTGVVNNGVIWAIGLFIDGLTFSFFLWADSIELAMILIFFHGIGIPLIIVSRTSIIQLYAPNKYHGRIFSVVHLGVVGTTALSSGIIGAMTSVIPVKFVFFFIGIGASICGLISAGMPEIRKLK